MRILKLLLCSRLAILVFDGLVLVVLVDYPYAVSDVVNARLYAFKLTDYTNSLTENSYRTIFELLLISDIPRREHIQNL